MNPTQITDFNSYIKTSKNILLLSSQPLDADCISSGIVLKKWLLHNKFNVDHFFSRKVEDYENKENDDLPFWNEFQGQDTRDLLQSPKYDTIIFVDGANLVQFYDRRIDLPIPTLDFSKKIIRIDHHQDSEVFYNACILNVKSSSTIELILDKVVPTEFLDKELATLAYAGISGDTGNFRWNFTRKTMEIAGKLLDQGANVDLLVNIFSFSKSLKGMEGISYIMQHLESIPELGVQILTLDYQKIKTDFKTKEDFNNVKDVFKNDVSRSIKGFPRGILIYEEEPNIVTVSARGNNYLNKINFAMLLRSLDGNGGGHFNAAGLSYKGDIYELKQKIISAIKKELENGPTNNS